MSMAADENARNFTLTVKPDVLAWRGRFTIWNLDIDIEFKAAKSSNASSVVLDLAGFIPDTLCLEMVPLVDVWPGYLNNSQANEFTIDLFFLPEERDNDVHNSLLTDVTSTDSALKAVIRGGFELLVFTSLHLPEKLHRLDGKVYFWGLFMEKSASCSSYKSNSNLDIQNNEGTIDLGSDPSDSSSSEVEICEVYDSDEQRALKSTDQVKRTGRKFDDAWVHAEPFDSLQRKKAQCKYCGFIIKYDGISRLKAHLAGMNPCTPVCDKVSPEVRKEMADWYKKWARNSKFPWVTRCQGSDRSISRSFDVEKSKEITSEQIATNPVDIMRKRIGRSLDAAWAHAEQLNDNKMGARCNYCGFISKYGGISRLKVHLSGESPRVPACLKVPQKLKEDMAGWFRKWMKTSKVHWILESQGNSEPVQASKRQLEEVNAWEHVIRLDENGQHIKCKHCNFVPKHGGIECMIVHLAGGDPQMQLKGCPNVSPGELDNSNKKTKRINMLDGTASSREDWRS